MAKRSALREDEQDCPWLQTVDLMFDSLPNPDADAFESAPTADEYTTRWSTQRRVHGDPRVNSPPLLSVEVPRMRTRIEDPPGNFYYLAEPGPADDLYTSTSLRKRPRLLPSSDPNPTTGSLRPASPESSAAARATRDLPDRQAPDPHAPPASTGVRPLVPRLAPRRRRRTNRLTLSNLLEKAVESGFSHRPHTSSVVRRFIGERLGRDAFGSAFGSTPNG